MRLDTFLLLFLSCFILLIDTSVSQKLSNKVHYSTIVEADGYAETSQDYNIDQLRELAFNNAKRDVLEKTMIHIKSYSKVENYKLEYDLIQSEAEGYLRILEKKDFGFSSENKYHVWIKAEVIYDFGSNRDQKEIGISDMAPLLVKIWTEQDTYLLNEKVKVFLLANKACFVKLIYQDAENNVLQIFPNQHKDDNYLEANRIYTIPDNSDTFELSVSRPFGIEKITVLASTARLGDAPVEKLGADFYRIMESQKKYSIKTRGVKIEKKEIPAEFFQESYSIKVSRK